MAVALNWHGEENALHASNCSSLLVAKLVLLSCSQCLSHKCGVYFHTMIIAVSMLHC